MGLLGQIQSWISEAIEEGEKIDIENFQTKCIEKQENKQKK